MIKNKIGLTIATTAALFFATAPITSTLAQAANGKVPCYGINSCKGTSSCKTSANNSCKGRNSCKGKGVKMVKNAQACKAMHGSLDDNTNN